ncbi:MAG TPA: 2'-5' RNA ligase family protein [Dehalococcoidia bacterium]|jgi:hypothetical protein|nr:2'-5' RNA ligase family protein [Dehalococcoidia bacterium]
MTSAPSPEGRRILVAEVTGEPGRRIQAWREQHDPEQARRLPPHSTLCYWAPDVPAEQMERQVRHAFQAPIEVCLGSMKLADNDQGTLFVEVLTTEDLDAALTRLYDAKHLRMPEMNHWRWHVTCVRETRGRDLDALWRAAAELQLNRPWRVDRVSYLQLAGDRYEEIAAWDV